MESRDIRAREYNTDVLNAKNGVNGATHTLYEPHPYLADRQNSDNRTRTSFQDSNVFGYKVDNNSTWQNTGRDTKSAGIRSGVYINAHTSSDNMLYDPNAQMKGNDTLSRQSYVAPTPDMYQHYDPQVSKARLGEELYGVTEFDKQTVKQDLQSRDEHWMKAAQGSKTTPEVAGLAHQDRKQFELHSSQSNHQPSTYQKPTTEYKIDSLASWKDPRKSEAPSNVIKDVNTFERRAQELSSTNTPLPASDYSHFVPKNKTTETTEEVDKRVKDAFFSDLYGQSGKYGPRNQVTKRSELSSHTGIFSKEGQSKGNRWGEEISAAQRRQDFLRTTGFSNDEAEAPVQPAIPNDTEINLARSQLRMPKVIKGSELESRSLHSDEFYNKYNVIKDHQEINVVSLIFKNLPPTMDADTLKVMSGAKHVVKCTVAIDNIKNQCTGEGEITIRLFGAETKEEIVNRFNAAGLIVEDKPEDAGKRKSNYHELASTGWRDHKLETAEKRHVQNNWETDKLSKVANLSTNVHMGTNENLVNMNRSYADVIRSNQDGLYQAQNSAETFNQQMKDWNNMRPRTSSGAFGGVSSNESFMKPTESFNTRSRLVQNSYRTQYF